MASKNYIQIIIDNVSVGSQMKVNAGVSITRQLHNKGSSVIDTARFTLANTPALARMLFDWSSKKNVSASIAINNKAIFSGYLRSGLSINIKNRYDSSATELNVELVDKMYRLNTIEKKQQKHFDTTVKKIVENALIAAGFTSNDYDLSDVDGITAVPFYENEDGSLKDVIDDILLQKSQVMYCDEAGIIRVTSWSNTVPADISELGLDKVLGDDIKVEQKSVREQGVQVFYFKQKKTDNYKLWEQYRQADGLNTDYRREDNFLENPMALLGRINQGDKDNNYKIVRVENVRFFRDCWFDVLSAFEYLRWYWQGYAGGNSRGEIQPSTGDVSDTRKYVDGFKQPWSYVFELQSFKIENNFAFFKAVWRSVHFYRGGARKHRPRSTFRLLGTVVMIQESDENYYTSNPKAKNIKKIKGKALYSEADAIKLAQEYQALLDNSAYSVKYRSNAVFALGDVFKIDLSKINTEITVRVNKRNEVYFPHYEVYSYVCDKVGDISESDGIRSKYIEQVILPTVIDEKRITLEEVQKRIDDTLKGNVEDGTGQMHLVADVNNRDVSLRVLWNAQAFENVLYKYEVSVDAGSNWSVLGSVLHRLYVHTVEFLGDTKVYKYRCTAYSAAEQGYFAISPEVDVEVKKITNDDLVDDLAVNNLDVAGNLIVRGTETKVNTTDLNIKDRVIDLNVGETGAGVTGSTSVDVDGESTNKKIAGIRVKRGTKTDSVLAWDEAKDKWEIDGQNVLLENNNDIVDYYSLTQINTPITIFIDRIERIKKIKFLFRDRRNQPRNPLGPTGPSRTLYGREKEIVLTDKQLCIGGDDGVIGGGLISNTGGGLISNGNRWTIDENEYIKKSYQLGYKNHQAVYNVYVKAITKAAGHVIYIKDYTENKLNTYGGIKWLEITHENRLAKIKPIKEKGWFF